MEIYLSENVVRKLIRQELYEVLQDKGIEPKKNEQQKVEKTKTRISNIIKNLAMGGVATGAIVSAININDELAKAEAERIEQVENEKAMMLSDLVDQKIESLIDMGLTPEAAQKIVVGVVLGVDKTQKDETKVFEEKIKVLNDLDFDTVKIALSDKFIIDMGNEGNQVMATISTQQGAFGVLPTRADQTIAGMSAEVQKSLEDLDVKTGIVDLQVEPDKKQKLRTLTFDPLELSYWDDKVVEGSKIEDSLRGLYGELTIPAFMYETVAPTVAAQQLAGELKENKIIRGKYV